MSRNWWPACAGIRWSDLSESPRKLQFELHKALDSNSYPATNEIEKAEEVIKPTAGLLLKEALDKKLDSDLSKTYKRNLRLIYDQFIRFLSIDELDSEIDRISTIRIDKFLPQFQSSGTI